MSRTIFVLMATLVVGCARQRSVADFGVGTERVTQVGAFMLRWGHETYKYVTDPRTKGHIKKPTGFQPHEEVIYAGVLSGSIVLEHKSYRAITTENRTYWILGNSQTTYHPLSTTQIVVGSVVMDIKRADGKSIHFVVREMGGNTSTTIGGPTKTVAEPPPKKVSR